MVLQQVADDIEWVHDALPFEAKAACTHRCLHNNTKVVARRPRNERTNVLIECENTKCRCRTWATRYGECLGWFEVERTI